MVPRALTIATSDSGGGAGIQADLKAFAAAGVYGTSALVALTAQNTTAVTAVHELPPDFIRAQLDAVFDDIGVDAAKTGMLFSRPIIETVAEFLERHPVPLVVDPGPDRQLGRAAAAGRRRRDADRPPLSARDGRDAEPARGGDADGDGRAHRGATWPSASSSSEPAAALVTGGHGETAVDHLFDGREHLELPVERYDVPATHGAGCTHSATLTALLARGLALPDAARGAAGAASEAVRHGLVEIGSGEGPVDVLNVKGAA